MEASARSGGSADPSTVLDTSSPDERERLLSEALAHAEARDAVYRRPLEPGGAWWKGALASVLLVLAGFVAAAPPAWLGTGAGSGSESELVEDARVRGAGISVYLQARHIEAFRAVERRLPVSLAEIGGGLPGVRYVRSSDRVYQLVAYGPDGRAVVYDSARPTAALGREAERLEGVEAES